METEAKLRIRMKKTCGPVQALKRVTAHAPSPQEVTERCAPPEHGGQPGKSPRLRVFSKKGGGTGMGQKEGRVMQEDTSDSSWQEPGDNQETLKRPQDCRELPGKK